MVWVLLTVAFEITLGRFVMSLAWDRIISDYDFRHGGLMAVDLLCMMLIPWAAARGRGIR